MIFKEDKHYYRITNIWGMLGRRWEDWGNYQERADDNANNDRFTPADIELTVDEAASVVN